MTEEQLKTAYDIVKAFIQDEREMRRVVFAKDEAKLKRKLRDCSKALVALAAIKDVAKLATEESPEQVELLADPALMRRGGY